MAIIGLSVIIADGPCPLPEVVLVPMYRAHLPTLLLYSIITSSIHIFDDLSNPTEVV